METFQFRILRPILARSAPEMTHTTAQGVIVRQKRSANVCARRCAFCPRVLICVRTGVQIYGAISPKIFRSVLFVKNQSYPKIKMPLTYVGGIFTINFDKTITKKFAITEISYNFALSTKKGDTVTG